MTRDKIENAYLISDRGVILSPGKFEGEMIFAPHFYEQWLNGEGEPLFDGCVCIMDVTPRERNRFRNEIEPDTVAMVLEETNDGFVTCVQVNAEKRDQLKYASETQTECEI